MILFVIVACSPESKLDYTAIDDELETLTSFESKANYLEKLQEEDQRLRQGISSEVIHKYGSNSKEHHEFMKESNAVDRENLHKIERYIAQYGYPKKNEFGERAALTPFLIIHHSPSYEDKKRNFKIIYQAFLEGEIDNAAITLYLGRMYEIKKGERLRMENPYTAEEEIERFIKELNLESESILHP